MLVYRCVNFYLELNFKVLVFFKICCKCGRINIEFIDVFLIFFVGIGVLLGLVVFRFRVSSFNFSRK